MTLPWQRYSPRPPLPAAKCLRDRTEEIPDRWLVFIAQALDGPEAKLLQYWDVLGDTAREHRQVERPVVVTDVDYIRVMSLYKSKGLTADLVVVVGCIQGLIPFIPDDLSSAERDRALEEQRRLFYVAITRTRQTRPHAGTLPGWRPRLGEYDRIAVLGRTRTHQAAGRGGRSHP